MSKYLSQIIRSRLLVFFLTFPLVVIGSVLSTTTFENEISTWLPVTSVERENYSQQQQLFGSNEVIMITWPDCKIDNPALPGIESKLLACESEKYFSYVANGYSIDHHLRDSLELSSSARLKRISGYWVNPANDLTFLAAKLSDAGADSRSEALAFVYDVLKESGIEAQEVRLAGPSVNLVWIDSEGFWSPLRAIPFIVVVVFIISWIFLGN